LKFLGDAFPAFWPNFGAGVMAAFLGACLGKSIESETVWFHPAEDKEIGDISFEYDPDNIWFSRIRDFYEAALNRWEGLVQLGMTDLGGNLDVLSSFRPSEKLLLDLYDHPQQVKDLTWQAHEMWWKYFDEFNSMLQPVNPGYTTWASIFSAETNYMLQCDFCYMIGPDMFDEFVKPELAASCKRLGNAFYHLDGPGELPHLDSLLSIPELKGVQWVPGAGAPDCAHWPEVYKKIRDAGKLIQLFGGPETLDAVARQLGSAEGIALLGSATEKEANDCVEKWTIDN
jgi:5-methyltetrahydrofolate--homocysteine methyltransferase